MGERIRIGQLQLHFLATTTETAGGLTLFEMTVPTQARVPVAHYHKAFEETVYGLDGILTFTVDGTAHEIRTGDSCIIPRGAVHHFINAHEADARVICMLTPAVIGPEYFRDIADLASAGGPPDPQKIGEVMRRYGLIPVAPTAVPAT